MLAPRLPLGLSLVLPVLSIGDPQTFGPELFEAPNRLVQPRIAVCDLDGDGGEELLVSGHIGLLVHATLSQGGAIHYQTASVPTIVRHAVAADLDGDGIEEVVVAGEHLFVFPNRGGFDELGQPWSAGPGAHDFVAVGDVDGDGDLDLVASAGAALRTYGNEGPAGFRMLSEVEDLTLDPVLAMGDWNGDGFVDVARHVSPFVRIRLGDGTGGWDAPVDHVVGHFGGSIRAGDVDGDGDADLLAPAPPSSSGLRLLLGVGDGTFVDGPGLVGLFAASQILGASLVDVEGDGRCEVLVVNASGCYRIDDPAGAAAVARWPMAAVVDWAALRNAHTARPAIVGLVELGEPTPFHDSWGLALYDARSTGDAGWMLDASPPAQYPSNAYVHADFNGDGHFDRLIRLEYGGDFRIRLGSSEGWTGPEYGLGFGATIFLPFDADGDGDLDLLCKNDVGLSVELLLHLNDGRGVFGQGVGFDPGVSPLAQFGVLGDLDGNGLDDLGAAVGPKLTVLLHLGDGRFAVGSEWTDFGLPDVIADLDGDGALDFVLNGLWQNRIAFGDGKGGIRHVLGGPSVDGLPTRVLAAGDLVGDGRIELVTRISAASGHQVGVHSSRDGVHWDAPLLLEPDAYVNGAQVVDVDGDSVPDLLLRRSGPRMLILRQVDAGTFEPWANVAWYLHTPLVHDVDGDGLPEVIGPDGILTRGTR